ncbi:hypothetical protein [Oscillatoria sp. HE19RPO]|uniref:hypothetical protein n=1 Tax=Oscillatoria sp. HE19RPO TaxID=2954806 RepID=UPI0020C24C67|nr:hypothetical protein [Oscillatoria sp. HE19RPO]
MSKKPHPQGWGYTDEARLRGLTHKIDLRQPDLVLPESCCDSKNPHPKGWGYTDEARLRGLTHKIDLKQPDLVLKEIY